MQVADTNNYFIAKLHGTTCDTPQINHTDPKDGSQVLCLYTRFTANVCRLVVGEGGGGGGGRGDEAMMVPRGASSTRS